MRPLLVLALILVALPLTSGQQEDAPGFLRKRG
mgnify:CR=1 FL=1